jgi:hypothetical protein
MMCKMLTGQGCRANNPTFVANTRIVFLAIAMIFTIGLSRAAMPVGLPTPPQTHVLVMPDCAGTGATATVTMDADYISNFSGCTFGVDVAANGCTATVTIPCDCVPATGTHDLATIVVRNKFNQVHAVFLMRAVDGIVNISLEDF